MERKVNGNNVLLLYVVGNFPYIIYIYMHVNEFEREYDYPYVRGWGAQ